MIPLLLAAMLGAPMGLAASGRAARAFGFLLVVSVGWAVGALGPDLRGDSRHHLLGLACAGVAAASFFFGPRVYVALFVGLVRLVGLLRVRR